MLPTTRRRTGTPRLDLQCPTQWDKNVGFPPSIALWKQAKPLLFCFSVLQSPEGLIMISTKFSSFTVVCFSELMPEAVFDFLWWRTSKKEKLWSSSLCLSYHAFITSESIFSSFFIHIHYNFFQQSSLQDLTPFWPFFIQSGLTWYAIICVISDIKGSLFCGYMSLNLD